MTINEQEQTLTATRDEMNTIIDKALDRKIKSLPDRSALNRVSGSGYGVLENPNLGSTDTRIPTSDTRSKILKTFRFFNAVGTNDHQTLRSIMQTYEPEYVRTLLPQNEGTNTAGGYLVPQEFYADVLFLLNEYGFARKYCAQIQMSSNILNVSTLTGKPSVAWFRRTRRSRRAKAPSGD
jgi:HK97 family phage major capsid protein